jgi:8-hydroxy-5-deazaflavin:NADPH oxidoreductase
MSTTIESSITSIGIIGGTGREGKGLAFAWVKAGYQVLIGSRQAEKAQAAAEEIRVQNGGEGNISGLTNYEVAKLTDLIVITVPFSAHQETLESLKIDLQGKIVIDVTVPLNPPKVTKVQMPPAGSASLEAQLILGEDVRVVTAFQNISYENLNEGKVVDCDVLVCGNDKTARKIVIELVKAIGLNGFDAGPLANSVVVEGMTSILIGLNKQFGVKSSGLRITGVPR